jgi:hypothetical protein
LKRLAEVAKARSLNAREIAAASIQRSARAKAMKAFIESGGTLANFERWWPQLSQSIDTLSRGGGTARTAPPCS